MDTNVFVSAILGPKGASREVIRACLETKVQPLMGMALFAEYQALLSRKSLFESCFLDSGERDALLKAFLSVCQWTRTFFLWRPNLPDEDDNHIVELALAGGASRIVTLNVRDFRRGELAFPGLKIVKPAALLKELETWEP